MGREVIFDLSHPLPPGTEPFQTIPHPQAQRAGFVQGVARKGGGVVTGQIEPCIRKIDVFILSLSSTCLLLRCFIFRMVLHRGKRETQVTGYMQSFIERETSGYEASLVLFHRYKQWKKVHQNKTNLVQE